MAAPQKRDIELLPQEEWEKTSLGKFLKWILTAGRYIVIVTELVVISAFLSRFKLDRDLTNLHEEIEEKQARVQAMGDFEKEFRFLQKRIEVIQEIDGVRKVTTGLIENLVPLLPIDVSLSDFTVSGKEISLTATAFSEEGLATFLGNLKKSPQFNRLNLTHVSMGTEKETGIQFKISFEYSTQKELSLQIKTGYHG